MGRQVTIVCMGAYENMTDEEVLARAAGALRQRTELPIGSIEREIQRARFDAAMLELDRRVIHRILASIQEQDKLAGSG